MSRLARSPCPAHAGHLTGGDGCTNRAVHCLVHIASSADCSACPTFISRVPTRCRWCASTQRHNVNSRLRSSIIPEIVRIYTPSAVADFDLNTIPWETMFRQFRPVCSIGVRVQHELQRMRTMQCECSAAMPIDSCFRLNPASGIGCFIYLLGRFAHHYDELVDKDSAPGC